TAEIAIALDMIEVGQSEKRRVDPGCLGDRITDIITRSVAKQRVAAIGQRSGDMPPVAGDEQVGARRGEQRRHPDRQRYRSRPAPARLPQQYPQTTEDR